MKTFFIISIFLIFYSFLGYGLLLYFFVIIKRIFQKKKHYNQSGFFPDVTLLVAAYNEESYIDNKIENCLKLDYPEEKLQLIFVTDGSTDSTPERISKYEKIILFHDPERKGKMAAIKRVMPFIKTDIVVFTDANTFLNKKSIKELIKHYQNPKIGAVAGEKKIITDKNADASTTGEGFYWKYESILKKLDYELYSNVGAAGELFSIRRSLYQPVETDTIIDDHMIAMRIAEKGYIIAYEPAAFAIETASADMKEELKRKVRIAAGGIQSILRLKKAANPFINPVLTFQYISHRVLRWTIVPILLIIVFILNILIVSQNGSSLFKVLLFLQLAFYLMALTGLNFEKKNIKLKIFFIPFYFCMMNYAVLAGLIRYFRKKQNAAWEKSKRK